MKEKLTTNHTNQHEQYSVIRISFLPSCAFVRLGGKKFFFHVFLHTLSFGPNKAGAFSSPMYEFYAKVRGSFSSENRCLIRFSGLSRKRNRARDRSGILLPGYWVLGKRYKRIARFFAAFRDCAAKNAPKSISKSTI
jgi:hypothetical protein